jgi:hypothetical protein
MSVAATNTGQDDERDMFMRDAFAGAAPVSKVRAADAQLKDKVAATRTGCCCWCLSAAGRLVAFSPFLVLLLLLLLYASVKHDYLAKGPSSSSSSHIVSRVQERAVQCLSAVADVFVFKGPVASFLDLFVPSDPVMPICQCPGCKVRLLDKAHDATWPLHTSSSYNVQPITPLLPHELRLGMMRGVQVQRILDALSWHLASGSTASPMLCMHELAHGLGEDRRICVLHRKDAAGQFVPMLNPELKGYAELGAKEESSVVVAERPLVCKQALLARRRRVVVDIGFVLPSTDRVRLLLDQEQEALAFQLQWDQLRGAYNCSE